jgi:hypothetical protein
MCTLEAATLAQAAGIISGTGGLIGAVTQAESTEVQARQAENQAVMLEIQANELKEKGELTNLQLRQQASEVLAAQVSQTAGSGIDIGGATAREVFESTIRTGISDEVQNRINIRKQVRGLRVAAKELRTTKKALKRAARVQRLTAPIAFLAPALTGQAQAQSIKKQGGS